MPKTSRYRPHALRILQLIWSRGTVSRLEVAADTRYSGFLISKTCDKLLRAGFITEAGFGDSTGGRRPTLLSLRSGLGRIVGVHMGAVNVRVALTDVSGGLIDFIKGPSHAAAGPDVALPHLIELIDGLLDKAGVKPSELGGIGVGISGVLDRATGAILFWPKLPAWVNVPVKEILSGHYPTLVELEDTPRSMALAEQRLGAASSAKQFVYLAIGAGIGAAIFSDGRLYGGAEGFAGEAGHISVSENGPFCSCGNRGCLETLVSAAAIIRRAQEGLALGLSNELTKASGGDSQRISVESIAAAARQGDRFALRLLAETSTYLGAAIVSLVNLLNPELVVIGGSFASAVGDLCLGSIERVVHERGMMQSVKNLRICMSTLQESDWARGSALLVAEKALERMFSETLQSRRAVSSKRRKAATTAVKSQ